MKPKEPKSINLNKPTAVKSKEPKAVKSKEPKAVKSKEPKAVKSKGPKAVKATKEAVNERGFDVNERYSKKSDLEHVLLRPDTYIGGTDKIEREEWVYDSTSNTIVQRKVAYSPGLYKIFDEILVNARDHTVRDETCNKIRVDFNSDSGEIVVENNGSGVPVEWHKDGDCYLPEMIFGTFKSGENFSDTEQKTVGGRNGLGGKCCGVETKIPLWSGKTKLAKDVTIEDKLIGDDGTSREINSIIRGTGEMFEIKQSDGETYHVNGEHILTVHMPDHKVIFWDAVKSGWGVLWFDRETMSIKRKTESLPQYRTPIVCPECAVHLSDNLKRHYKRLHKGIECPKKVSSPPSKAPETDGAKAAKAKLEKFCESIPDDNVIDISIKDFMALNKTTQSRLAGLRGECVQWPKQDVMLDPYVLGLWLGDGHATGYGYSCYGEKDTQIMDYLRDWGAKNDAVFTKTRHCTYRIKSTSGCKVAPLKKLLSVYNLIGDKHVPIEYIMNDRETRLKVLAGFIDTDGTVMRDGKRIVITQGLDHKRLFEDMVLLVRSLGFYCSVSIKNTTWTYQGELKRGLAYNMNISGDLADIPTLLPRKKCVSERTHSSRTTGKLTITKVPDADFVGFQISGNERFLINDFTVTHNCSNAFSMKFEVDTVDKITGKRYVQLWENNMSVRHPPVITSCSKASYTRISFIPDYQRFGGSSPKDPGLFELLSRRVFDMAACTREEVLIYLNGEKLAVRTFAKYTDMFLGTSKTDRPRIVARLEDESTPAHPDRAWDITVALSEDGGFKQLSFVNGIATTQGGTHVVYIREQIVSRLCKLIRDKNPNEDIKPGYVRENLWLFVNAVVVNPSFSSQTKEMLSTEPDKFGFKHKISQDVIASIEKRLQISKRAIGVAGLRVDSALKKTDGRKKGKIRGILKLEDAKHAGKKRSAECTLIVTEGDSAKTMAMDGLQQIGRDFFGVFPARGKFINARNASKEQLAGNAEHNALKEIMGFREGADYEDDKMFATLRYGSMMMMTDQDVDGYHIKGLFYNWIIKTWPSLLKRKGFFKCFVTPIVRLQPTSKASRKQAKLFFNMGEYEAYRAANGTAGMTVRYLKGLGTSEKQEAREYFADYNRFVKEYHSFDDQVTMEQFDHAFSDKFADWRKEWLGQYDENNLYDYKAPVFKLDDYIDKELKHFSIYDNKRSIGHCMDGLKVSQRKVLWGIRKLGYWNTTKKVLALAGDVSSLSSYHHGEKSLMDTIVGMAQDFVDSNNLNLLYPSGQFGSRLQQGSDASDPRYIFTRLNPITQYLFRSEDDKVLKYEQDDEGKSIEPRHFSPIIPMVLVNGCQGIGTGYSTTVPMYNPLDIIDQYVAKLSGATEGTITTANLIPWYNGFKGTIVPVPDQPGLFDSIGCYNRIDDTTLDVTEVPVGQSFDGYKAFLEDHLVANMNVGTEKQTEAKKAAAQLKHFLADYENMSFPTSCHFRLTFGDKSVLDEMLSDPKAPKGILKRLRLVCRLSTRNMYLFGVDGAIKKFESPEEIMAYHSRERLELYSTRKQYQLEELDEQIAMLTQKQRFIQLVLSGDIDVRNKSKQLIAKAIRAHNIVTDEPGGEDGDESDESEAVLTPQMKMLLKISLFDITEEEVAKFMDKIAALRVERDTLANTPPEHIWLSELNELRDAVVSHFDALTSSQSDDGAVKTVKAVKAKGKAVKAKTVKAVKAKAK